ncbi:uncharacterized protein LOC110630521 [Manihot esculenta]|uniref:uncharacterized protein LOC110630521 n=1 Tax=Manihot esculenta TaxID=3983 RepID=UPI000B5D1421|nr:uncharacterized protein LOC110630521 [Manihot esculenta]
MATKTWKIIPRPLLETILNNHAQHHRVPQPLILHGPAAPAKPPSFSNVSLTTRTKALISPVMWTLLNRLRTIICSVTTLSHRRLGLLVIPRLFPVVKPSSKLALNQWLIRESSSAPLPPIKSSPF